ncbi:8902_t:CDS:2, partial [Ambispora leptoticha]
ETLELKPSLNDNVDFKNSWDNFLENIKNKITANKSTALASGNNGDSTLRHRHSASNQQRADVDRHDVDELSNSELKQRVKTRLRLSIDAISAFIRNQCMQQKLKLQQLSRKQFVAISMIAIIF